MMGKITSLLCNEKTELNSTINNDQTHSGEKSPKEIVESDDLDDDYRIKVNKGGQQSLRTESQNKVENDENSFQSPINDEAIILDTTPFRGTSSDHVKKETINTSTIIESKNSVKDKENIINDDIDENNNTIDIRKVHQHNKTFNTQTEKSNQSSNEKLSENKVQYTLDNKSDEIKVNKTSNDSVHKNKSISVKDKSYMEETELLETSPSIREYYSQGISKTQNIKANLVPFNKDISNDDEISTTRKYKTANFELDYEEYSDETSFFGSDSSNDEVIPSQYEDAATYHEILVGAAQDPRYEHDEYVEEKEYSGNRREYFPLNSDQGTSRNDEYPERKKRPHIEINAVVGISVGAFFFILLGTRKYYI